MQCRNDLTQQQVRDLFDYSPDAGLLIWKVERYRKHPGDVAGCIHKIKNKDYWCVSVSVNYKRYLAHRIIWLWVTGEWPDKEIDHKDRDGTNNRWLNLRKASHPQNGKNLSLKKTNTTGFSGVSKARNGRYRARIMVNRKEIYLGEFASVEEAAKVRRRAALKYFGEFRGASDA